MQSIGTGVTAIAAAATEVTTTAVAVAASTAASNSGPASVYGFGDKNGYYRRIVVHGREGTIGSVCLWR